MNKIFWKNAAVCLLAVSASACCRKEVNFENFKSSETALLSEGRSEKIEISVDMDVPKPGGKTNEAIGDVIIATLFGSDYTGMGAEEVVSKWTEGLVSEYRDTNLPMIKEMEAAGDRGPFGSFSWQCSKKGRVTGYYENICTYSTFTYSFTGGAHGISHEMNLNFDMKTGQLIEQEDILIPGAEDSVSALLKKHLNDNRETNVETFTDIIVPNGNFSIGPDGITFTYNQYEIAAYVFGIIDIHIPSEEIKPYLKPELKLYQVKIK